MPSKTSPSEVIWNPDSDHALGLCKHLTDILGVWPLNCQSLFSISRFFIVIISQVSMAINLIRALKGDCVAVDDVVNFLCLLASSMIVSLKVIVMRLNKTSMEHLIITILEDWLKVKDSEARVIMKKHALIARFVVIFQMGFTYIATLAMLLGPLTLINIDHQIDRSRESNDYNYSSNFVASSVSPFLLASENLQRTLPMGTACYVADLSNLLYVLVYLIQCIQLMACGTGNIGIDVYIFSVMLHVCAQFELLAINFLEFGQDHDVQNYGKKLEILVKRHNQLIKLSKNFEDTFNVMLLAQLSINAIQLSFLGLRLILSIKTGDYSISLISAVVGIYVLSLELFLYSYAGDYLMRQNEKICQAVYRCCWYDLPITVTKDLMFVMLRSNTPFYLTAGKMCRMNMDNFINILKAMASYFSMLRIVFDD